MVLIRSNISLFIFGLFSVGLGGRVEAQVYSPDTIDTGWIDDSVRYDVLLFDDSIRMYREYLDGKNKNSILFLCYGYYSKMNTKSKKVIDAGYFDLDGERHGVWYFGDYGPIIYQGFNHGVPLGLFREQYDNGSISRSGLIDTVIIQRTYFSIMVGEWATYYENGQIESLGSYRRPISPNERDSVLNFAMLYNYEVPLEHLMGIKQGKWYYYSRDGVLEKIEEY